MMLEFIVLGQVPGTNIFISFNESLMLLVTFLLGVRMYASYRSHQKLLASTEQAAMLLAVVSKKQKRRKK